MPFVRLQFRRGSASQWTSANPILADGELAIESDTNKFKIGNGNANWTLLPYGGLVGPTGAIGSSVPNDISFNGNIFVGRDVSFGSKLTVRNDVSFNTELRVGGNLNIRSNTASTSIGTGALIVNGGVGVGGNVWTGGNLYVALDASLNSRLLVGGNVLLSSSLIVGVDASFNGNTTFALLPFYGGNPSVTPATNQLVTKKYVDENGGTILLGANNTWTGNNTFNGSRFYVGGDASFNGNLTVREDVSFNKRLFVGGDSSFNSNLTVREDVSFNKRLFVGGDASFNGNLTVREDVSLNKRLFVGGDASFNGNLIVRGDVSFNDNLSVQSDSSFNNRLYVGRQIGIGVTANAAYALDVFGNIHMSGNLFLNNKLFSITSSDISLNANLSVGADASFNGNVFVAKTLNLRKTVLTGAATGVSATSIVAVTPIVELTGSDVNTVYFTLANGSYAGQTLIINSATAGGTGGGLFVNSAGGTNIAFNGSNCSQMRFSNAFQTVNLLWNSTTSQWIVASFQGVNFSGVSMNFGTYTSGDITLGAAGKVNISPGAGLGGMVVGSESSFAGNLSANGMDSSFNSNVYVSAGKRVGIGRLAGATYLLDVGGNINLTGNLYTNGVLFSAFDNSKDISLNANLTVAFDSSFNANLYVGRRLTVNGDVSLNQKLAVGLESSFAGNLSVNGMDSSFNSNVYVSAGKRVGIGRLAGATYLLDVGGNINLTGNLYTNGVLFSAFDNSKDISLNANLTVGFDSSFNANLYVGRRLTVNGDVSLNQRLAVHGADSSFNGNLYVGNRFIVNGDVSFNQRLVVHGADSSFNGNLYIGNRLIGNGDVSFNQRLAVHGSDSSFNGNLYVGNRFIVNGDVSLNQRLVVHGADSSFNGNLYVGGFFNVNGYVAADSYAEKFVNIASSSGSYVADFNNGLILYVSAFSGSSTPSLSITNLPTALNHSYVFTVVYSGAPTSTYFSSLDINGVSVPVNGTVSLTAATSYYIHQFCIFFTDATNISNICVVQNFNSSAPLSLVSPLISGNLSVAGDINLTGGNIYQNGTLFVGGGGGSVGPNLSLGGNLYVGGDVSFNGKLYGNGDVSFNQRLIVGGVIRTSLTTESTTSTTGALVVSGGAGIGGNISVGGNVNFVGNLYQNGVLFAGGSSTTGTTLSLTGTQQSFNSASGAFTVAGGAGIGGNVEVGGNVDIASRLVSTNGTTGALTVAGGVGISGVVNIGNTTASSSTTTGALVVNGGGVGITGAVYVGGNIEMTATKPLIRFSNQIANKKLVLYDDGLNDDPTAAATTSFYGFGINSSSIRYQVPGSGIHKFYSGSADGTIQCGPITASGGINALSFTATSDYRIKQNARSICDDPSFNVDVLRPITYTNLRAGKQDIGFIAHEVGEHYPYLVNGEKDGEQMQSLNYTGIIGILVKEIQELKKETQDLKKRVANLEKSLP